ncbi:hypothetical protein F5Y17DRAFT_415164 [Xylariaceae sp. FL0594]|nr:hypothetical protein F5Y17DRAFT_415164 [Xylariaceae sp. FL0594]
MSFSPHDLRDARVGFVIWNAPSLGGTHLNAPTRTRASYYHSSLVTTVVLTINSIRGDSTQKMADTEVSHDIKPIIITSKRSFAETKAALEATIPPLDLSYQALAAKGDYAGARAALKALPPLNNFILPPRNFTTLLQTIGEPGEAVAYEIGNPLTAVSMIKYKIDIGLHTPRRVLLRVDGDKVQLKVNPLAALVAKYGIPEVDAIARKLDATLRDTLSKVGGLDPSEE